MTLPFRKYEGAGNDFILFDDRAATLLPHFDQPTVARLCDRHFGIGADGLMLLRPHPDYDFEMVYWNSDGAPSSMCGNGGRCIVRFAADLGIARDRYRFLAVDGPHEAILQSDRVELLMSDVTHVGADAGATVLDTGSPHYVTFTERVEDIDVVSAGRRIRNGPAYAAKGINVNFVAPEGDGIAIATYERGVEDETLACGTGVTAAAIAHFLRSGDQEERFDIPVRAKGGRLSVRGRRRSDGGFTNLWLVGPARFVFRGEITL